MLGTLPDLTDAAQVTLAISDCLARGMTDRSVITMSQRRGELELDWVARRRAAIVAAAAAHAVEYGFELADACRLCERVLEQAIKGLEPMARAAQRLADQRDALAYS